MRPVHTINQSALVFARHLSGQMASSDDGDEDGDRTGSRLIDEQGRLFGLVNVVDALVVLLVLAVVVAGVALLFPGGDSGKPDSRFVTMDLGTQPEFVAEQISPGDTWDPDRTSDELVITDTYHTVAGNSTQVLIRAQLNGTTVEPDEPDGQPVFEFLDDPLRTGVNYTMVTSEYQTDGTVTRVEQNGTQLQTTETPFVVDTTVSEAVGDAIEVGDTFQRAGETLATIETIERLPGGDNQRLLLGMQGQTIERAGTQLFAGAQLRVGASVGFVGEGYEFTGEVRQPGTTDVAQASQSVVVEASISADTAETLTTGDTFTVGNSTVATIESVALYPAGETQRATFLGLEIATVDDGTERFADRPIRIGNTIPFRTDEYELSATIRERGTTAIDTVERPFVIETTVPDVVAADIDADDTFTLSGRDIVSVRSVTSYTTDVAGQRRVILGVDVAVRADGDELRFGEQRLRVGESIPVRTGEYDITGEIIDRGTLEEPGEQTTQSIVFGVDNVRPERAATLTVGLREQTRDLTTAVVRDKVDEPAVITLTSEDGNIFERQHPINRDVELEIELTARELTDGNLRFRGESLLSGEQLTLELGSVRVTGTVFEISDR